MAIRNIVRIDQERCDGCGLCVPSCEEGAIAIIDGKATVVSEIYCDGLGACLGHCPQDAISIEQREAEEFDQEAVERHLAATKIPEPLSGCTTSCPGTAAKQLNPAAKNKAPIKSEVNGGLQPAQLANWPVQLHLVPPQAPYLHQADLLLVADCVPFACANFHSQILDGRPVVIGCPKLDDCHYYVAKLAAVIQQSQIQSISIVHMEVPCCTGLLRVAEAAIQQAGVSIPLHETVVTTRGEIIERGATGTGTITSSPSTATPTQLPIL